ncbi:MAG TPA: hypothetical protein VLK36_08940 [Gaiellaceae bacterium]|nr:hypothetical protein [Gaiellaceae bacterium]
MATIATPARPTLTDEQFMELASLVKGADSVELKLTVPQAAHRTTIASLGMDPLDAQIRQVYFFDTPDLTLDTHGVVVRARRVQKKGDDSVVKLRPVVPHELPGPFRKSPNFGVEVDAMPGGFVCSGSMKRAMGPGVVRDTILDGKPIKKLFSKEQRAVFAEYAPEGVTLDDLKVLGPIFVLKLKYVPEGFSRPLVGEMWLYPDDRWILELSTKCAPTEAFQVSGEARAFLASRGVSIGGEQQTKTRTALEFFAGRLKAETATKPRRKTTTSS